MEIKRMQEMYPYRSTGGTGSKNIRTSAMESQPVNRDGGMEGDKVHISPEASFRAKLDTAVRNYASEAKTREAAVAQRVDVLKEQYQDDRCPISGTDVARAMMNIILGG